MNKNKLIIIGYSGHSYLCIETAINNGTIIVGYCELEKISNNPYNLNFLGKEEDLDINNQLFIAIGNNAIRRKVYRKLMLNKKYLDTSIIHSKSIVSNSALIQKQNFISSGAIINPKVIINIGCIINTGAIIEHECNIGCFSHICPGAVLAGNVLVGESCIIGANSVIKQGIKIGNNVIIGAGSVIVKDVPNNVMVVGNPGRIIKRL
jgi:sugar O-acyltransferase (sialic acid O-acetyltransferase NeuD family)